MIYLVNCNFNQGAGLDLKINKLYLAKLSKYSSMNIGDGDAMLDVFDKDSFERVLNPYNEGYYGEWRFSIIGPYGRTKDKIKIL